MRMSNSSKTQLSLFDDDFEADLDAEQIILPNLNLLFYKRFLSANEATVFFEELITKTNWRQDSIKMYNKYVYLPRLTAWFGDNGTNYKYSGINMNPTPWTPILDLLKTRVQKIANCQFNSVLLNYYRTGNDSVGWHQDNEPELGKNPTIASISLGATRLFQLKHLDIETHKLNITLPSGSLLLMTGETQHFWKHQIPKTNKEVSPRINLTFRYIFV